MASKMLIDAAHPEETRVVAVKGNRVEEFDYESATKKQLRGNIYLAKVTRVEPSLQAAFVDYGVNRHGFLAFTEIHPDYYQIPVADRQALLEEEALEQSRASAEEAAEDDEAASGRRRRRGRRGRTRPDAQGRKPQPQRPEPASETPSIAKFEVEEDDEIDTTPRDDESASVALEETDLVHEVSEPAELEGLETVSSVPEEDDEDDGDHAEVVGQLVPVKEGNGELVAERVESVGSEDALEEVPERARRRRGRPYKIQEVIHRRQIILVQVVAVAPRDRRGGQARLTRAGLLPTTPPRRARVDVPDPQVPHDGRQRRPPEERSRAPEHARERRPADVQDPERPAANARRQLPPPHVAR